MGRIPFGEKGTTAGNLVEATRILVPRAGAPAIDLVARLPQNTRDWTVALHAILKGTGVPDDETVFFIDRLLVLLTSCPDRRLAEYEQITWWDFIGAQSRSKAYETLLAQGLTRSLVALEAKEGSTRTVGYTLLQLFGGIITPQGFDRLLTGPTNEVWLNPWIRYLESRGVRLLAETEARSFLVITGVVVEKNTTSRTLTADYYIAAIPVEIMAHLVSPELAAAAPSLANLSFSERAVDEWYSVLLEEGRATRTRSRNVCRFAMGIDVDFAETVLAQRPAFKLWRRICQDP
jgi:15-cis-phytoene desaturase